MTERAPREWPRLVRGMAHTVRCPSESEAPDYLKRIDDETRVKTAEQWEVSVAELVFAPLVAAISTEPLPSEAGEAAGCYGAEVLLLFQPARLGPIPAAVVAATRSMVAVRAGGPGSAFFGATSDG